MVTRTFTHWKTQEVEEELSLLQDYEGKAQAEYCAAHRPNKNGSSSFKFPTTDLGCLLTQRRGEKPEQVSLNTLELTELQELPLYALGDSAPIHRDRL